VLFVVTGYYLLTLVDSWGIIEMSGL
jgi:hypothetical protein